MLKKRVDQHYTARPTSAQLISALTTKTLHGAGAQTPPADQPAERALSGNAAFVNAVQAGLARMLADLASAGVTERPLQVPAHTTAGTKHLCPD